MELTVKLESFEGPLDLLLHLLEKNKVNIYDIPIVEITNQYMEYIHEMERQDLDIMSEFMVMAATLIDIKRKCCCQKKRQRMKRKWIRVQSWYNSCWSTSCIKVFLMN